MGTIRRGSVHITSIVRLKTGKYYVHGETYGTEQDELDTKHIK